MGLLEATKGDSVAVTLNFDESEETEATNSNNEDKDDNNNQ